jgi:DNA mismatch endonuclease (patch repair protein)
MATLLAGAGLFIEAQARDLPGRPDFVLREHRIAIFVDGSFWHGWRFPAWRHKLSERWEAKIEKNRIRDRRNHQALRRKGWKVMRIWDFQLQRNPELCLKRVLDSVAVVQKGLAETMRPGLQLVHSSARGQKWD